MTVFYVRPKTGSDAAAGTTPATAWQSLTLGALAARIAPGDEIRVEESGAPTNAGNAQWTNGLSTVTMSVAANLDIFTCEAAFTAVAAGVSTTTSATRKQGTLSSQITVPSTVIGGLLAYRNLGGAVNAAAYRQICFWIRSNTAIAANQLRVDLCTNTTGTAIAQSALVGYALPASTWVPIVVDTGGALSATINSVALFALGQLSVSGSVQILLDNIFAAKAPGSVDEITLTSLISKTGTDEPWYPIRSVSGATINLDTTPNASANATQPAYCGTTAVVATFVRQTLRLPAAFTLSGDGGTVALDTPWGLVNDSGTNTLPITISGGWDAATMAAQVSETIIDMVTGHGSGVSINGNSSVTVQKLSFANCRIGHRLSGSYIVLEDCGTYRSRQYALFASDNPLLKTATVVRYKAVGVSVDTIQLRAGTLQFTDLFVVGSDSGTEACVRIVNSYAYAPSATFDNLQVYDAPFAMRTSLPVLVRGGKTLKMRLGYDFYLGNTAQGAPTLTLCDFTFTNPNPVAIDASMAGTGYTVRLQNQNLVPNNHMVTVEEGQIRPDLAFFRLGAKSWQISPLGATRTSRNPIIFPLGPLWKLLSPPAAAQSVSVYVYRDNANVRARLRIPAGQLCTLTGGDLTAEDAGPVANWNQITIPITMVQDGVIDAQLEVYTTDGLGGYNVWTDDLS